MSETLKTRILEKPMSKAAESLANPWTQATIKAVGSKALENFSRAGEKISTVARNEKVQAKARTIGEGVLRATKITNRKGEFSTKRLERALNNPEKTINRAKKALVKEAPILKGVLNTRKSPIQRVESARTRFATISERLRPTTQSTAETLPGAQSNELNIDPDTMDQSPATTTSRTSRAKAKFKSMRPTIAKAGVAVGLATAGAAIYKASRQPSETVNSVNSIPTPTAKELQKHFDMMPATDPNILDTRPPGMFTANQTPGPATGGAPEGPPQVPGPANMPAAAQQPKVPGGA